MIDLKKLKSGTDIRGKALGEDAVLTCDIARAFGHAFATWLKTERGIASPRIALGRDSRLTGVSLLTALAQGMAAAGAQVESYGLATTPAMYMSLLTEDFACDGAVMVTASHHPFDRNGFKFMEKEGGVSSAALDQIITLAKDASPLGDAPAAIDEKAFMPVYAEQLKSRVREGLCTDVAKPLLGLHIVVDAGNGAGGFYADMLSELGAWTEGSQFLDPDGHFPNHIPNPENKEAMASISTAVVRNGADIGVIFDADCDRAAIVDHIGREINRNRLIALISAILLDKTPGITVVTDSVTSSGLAAFIGEWGGVHYRYKRGYRNVIEEAIRLNQSGINCPVAIETSGHAALRENHFLDDGMYFVTVLICEAMRLKQDGRELSSLIGDLREPVESAEIRLAITAENFRESGKNAIARVMDYATFMPAWHIAPDNHEGVRISFNLSDGLDNGWLLFRLSVHDPVMPINLESDVAGGVLEMAKALLQVLSTEKDLDLTNLYEFIKQEETRHE